jgi:hypothetical protein
MDLGVRREMEREKGKKNLFCREFSINGHFLALPLAKLRNMTRIRLVAASVAKERRRRGQGSSFVELVIGIY